MRRTSAVLSIAALVGVALVGCAPAGTAGASCDRVADTDPDTMSLIDVTGDFGEKPEVEVFTPFTTKDDDHADVLRGEGPAITSTAQPGALEITLFDGETGSELIGTAYSGEVTAIGPLTGWTEQFPALEDALLCATEGSRVAVAMSEEGVTAETRAAYAQAGVPQEGSIIAVVDVVKVMPQAASGSVQFNDGLGLPTVVRAPEGRTGIIVPDAEAPADEVVQTLIKGDGPTIAADDVVVAQVTGVDWEDRTVTTSTWDEGTPLVGPASDIVPGFADALEGQTVGSQVLVVVPAEGGEQAQGATAYAVDILGTIDAPEQGGSQ